MLPFLCVNRLSKRDWAQGEKIEVLCPKVRSRREESKENWAQGEKIEVLCPKRRGRREESKENWAQGEKIEVLCPKTEMIEKGLLKNLRDRRKDVLRIRKNKQYYACQNKNSEIIY